MTYRNYDSSAPQVVAIQWEQVELSDPDAGSPDENDDGFWPSEDPDSAGYVDPISYAEEMDKAKARMAAWENGEWGYVGVIARAHVSVPIGGSSFARYTFDSHGVWGIDSDDDSADYRAEVFEDEKASLALDFVAIGAAFAEGAGI